MKFLATPDYMPHLCHTVSTTTDVADSWTGQLLSFFSGDQTANNL